MVTTRVEARRILRRVYPELKPLRITRRVQFANLPNFQIALGHPTLAWFANDYYGKGSVWLGKVTSMETNKPMAIDWSWQP